jgi:hypothetical protein
MKLFFANLFLGLLACSVWGQTSTITLPASFALPPPPNPAAIQDMGSLQFQAFRNNMLLPQLNLSPSYGANVGNALPVPNSVSGLGNSKSIQSTLLPQSFGSSIQGLQFVTPSQIKP